MHHTSNVWHTYLYNNGGDTTTHHDCTMICYGMLCLALISITCRHVALHPYITTWYTVVRLLRVSLWHESMVH